MAAEHALDDARHRLNQFFNGKGPDRCVFTLNCTDALNMAIKGVLAGRRPRHHHRPGTQLVSRPLRAMENGRRHHPDPRRGRRRRDLDPDAIRGAHAEDAARRHDARQQRARHRPADRGDRPDRPRARRPVPRRCRPDGRRRARSTCRPCTSTCSPSPATRRCSARPAPGPCTSAPRAKLSAWREGGTGGDSSSETQPKEFPYFLEGGTPNVLGVAGLAAGIQWVEARRTGEDPRPTRST